MKIFKAIRSALAAVLVLPVVLAGAQSTDGVEWLRVYGSTDQLYLASHWSVSVASTVEALEFDLGPASTVARILACPTSTDGNPMLDEAVELYYAVSTGGVASTKRLAIPGAPVLSPGDWWIVLQLNSAQQAGWSEGRIGFRAAAAGEETLLGDGSEVWSSLPGICPRIVLTLAPVGVGKAGSGGGSGSAAGAPVASYRGIAPNPLVSNAYFSMVLSQRGRVTVSIYDVRGRLVRQLGPYEFPVGEAVVRWDARGNDGGSVARGVYHARIEAPGILEHSRLLVLR